MLSTNEEKRVASPGSYNMNPDIFCTAPIQGQFNDMSNRNYEYPPNFKEMPWINGAPNESTCDFKASKSSLEDSLSFPSQTLSFEEEVEMDEGNYDDYPTSNCRVKGEKIASGKTDHSPKKRGRKKKEKPDLPVEVEKKLNQLHKEIHNTSERLRRRQISQQFSKLSALLPDMKAGVHPTKQHKLSILENAVQYITNLISLNESLSERCSRLERKLYDKDLDILERSLNLEDISFYEALNHTSGYSIQSSISASNSSLASSSRSSSSVWQFDESNFHQPNEANHQNDNFDVNFADGPATSFLHLNLVPCCSDRN